VVFSSPNVVWLPAKAQAPGQALETWGQRVNYYPPDGGILGRQTGKGFWMK